MKEPFRDEVLAATLHAAAQLVIDLVQKHLGRETRKLYLEQLRLFIKTVEDHRHDA